MKFTGSGNGFISKSGGVPGYSTWFWLPDKALTLCSDSKHYEYPAMFGGRGLSYVGEPDPVQIIPAHSLVRVSLARWWKQTDADADFEERCYLQLSGWY